MWDIIIPERVQGKLRECLQSMINSCQSEAKAIAEVVCDSVDGCDDEANFHVVSIADEFVGWGKALMEAACPQFKVGDRVHFTDPDRGISSGDGEVTHVQHTPCVPDSVIAVKKDDGGEVEAFPIELTKYTVQKYQQPILDDRGGSPDNSYRCGNCDALFDKGGGYPSDTFCSSHCYYKYHGESCPKDHDCQDCRDDM